MTVTWTHVGRLWTNGEPFLAVDDGLREAWRGSSDDQYDQVVDLGWQDTGIPVGTGRAVLVGGDGVVRDDSWIEVFTAPDGSIAVLQASGPRYPDTLAEALRFPRADDQAGEVLRVPSGALALFSAAADGAGAHSTPLTPARPGPVPLRHGPPPSLSVEPGLLLPAAATSYQLRVRWYTELDDDACFARWLLTPLGCAHP
ncbi:hypothetical protein [Micromonospora coxensis]|uniref:hypothetical protein n=1 Tax=Micromonospora coxensis TaxID=356852 RepID=UPI003418D07F